MLSNAIEQAQKTVESRNFQTRKNVLEFDDVMNQQRNLIRRAPSGAEGEDMRETVRGMLEEYINTTIHAGLEEGMPRLRSSWTRRCLHLKNCLCPGGASEDRGFGGKADADKIAAAVLPVAEQVYDARERPSATIPTATP